MGTLPYEKQTVKEKRLIPIHLEKHLIPIYLISLSSYFPLAYSPLTYSSLPFLPFGLFPFDLFRLPFLPFDLFFLFPSSLYSLRFGCPSFMVYFLPIKRKTACPLGLNAREANEGGVS